MAEQAATIYRLLRAKGVTIRKSNDCLIAAYAIEAGLPVAHLDRDFDRIARHTDLAVIS
jgi:predicted nucleic acid-binding protein